MDVARFALHVPKAELHVHLDGCVEPELKLQAAERNGIALAETTVEEVRASYRFHDLTSFLAVYYPNAETQRTEQDFFEVCASYLRRAAAQGVRHCEMFFDPQFHTGRGIGFGTVVAGYRRAIVTVGARLGVRATLIMCFMRERGADYAMATLLESLPYREWIVGVGLDSQERDHPPREFAAVFARARAEGYLLTVHCDVDQDRSIENIRQALEELEVDRIDHGTNIVEDDRLLDLAAERGVGFTVCPHSNGNVVPDMKAPAIRTLLDRGIAVAVGSDDPALHAGYVGDNYVTLARYSELDVEQVRDLARRSFEASWLPAAVREGFLAEVAAFGR